MNTSARLLLALGGVACVGLIVSTALRDGQDQEIGTFTRDADFGGLAISPESPTGQQQLRVSQGATQARMGAAGSTSEGDTWIWTVNGVEAGRGDTLDPAYFRRGDVVRVASSSGPGAMAPSAEVTIGNTPPRILGARIIRDPADQQHLKAIVDIDDPDGDVLATSIQWVLDGQALRNETSSSYPVSSIVPGQQLQIDVIASDGELEARHISAPFSVENRPPSLEVASVPRLVDEEGGKIAVLDVTTMDADGDTVEIRVESPFAKWDPARGALVWSVVDGTEVFEVRLRAVDGSGASASRSLTLRR